MNAELKRRTTLSEAVVNVALGLVFVAVGAAVTTLGVWATWKDAAERASSALVFVPVVVIPASSALRPCPW